ncbi:outer membrane protein assembly factor BamD [Magnetococcales bacterium HHB-1]
MTLSRFFSLTFVALTLLLSQGCSSKKDNPTEEADLPPQQIYQQGIDALKKSAYTYATRFFRDVEQKHPFSAWAAKAQLAQIYAEFKNGDYEDSLSSANRFIRLHPRYSHVSYAYYMRALSYYKQIPDARRSQEPTRLALTALQEVENRFPESDYADEARDMMKVCRDRLAAQEILVGRFYLDRAEYIAAINRFKEVISNPEFNRTPYVEEALFSIALASHELGLKKELVNYTTVLGHNFPKGLFYPWALDLAEGNIQSISATELTTLRQGIEDSSLFKRFFEGLRPGVPGLQ